MGQDIRELLQKDLFTSDSSEINDNHALRFLDKLDEALPVVQEKKKFFKVKRYYSAAASVLVTVGLASFLWIHYTKELQHSNDVSVYKLNENRTNSAEALAAISPEFKKIEDYYLTSIKVELSQINVTDANKRIVASFMQNLAQLNNEYQVLEQELLDSGTNEQALEALIQNLQMRLELLQQLKSKLKNVHEYKKTTYENLQA